MDTHHILTADILDIVFDGRNKAYGAYNLRKTYQRRVVWSLATTLGIIACLFAGSVIAKKWKPAEKSTIYVEDYTLKDLPQDTKKADPPPPPPIQKTIPQVAITRFVPPQIVRDLDVTNEEQMPDQDQLNDTKIGNINQVGDKDDGTAIQLVEKGTGGTAESPKGMQDMEETFRTVEIESEFPGGHEAWKKYLEKNLNTETATGNGAPPGKYTVVLAFKVDKQGNISDITVEKDPGYGTAEEAKRVIKKGPSWKPANQNGRLVSSIKRQAITFLVNEE